MRFWLYHKKSSILDKIFRQTVVFMWTSTLRQKFSFYFFQEFSASIDKIFILGGNWALGYTSLKFWDFLDIS